jgi:proline iminopeptidase
VNNGFIAENQILDNAKQLAGIPGIIVHGRYDMVSPLEASVSLHNLWPESQLNIVRDAGHAASEPTIVDALIRATRDISRRFLDEDDY